MKLRSHNINLCEDCFLDFFKRRVRKTIGRYKLISKGEKVLVAVSGGKDSLALWDVLLELGFEAAGLYIDLGIGGYSALSREKALKFAESRGRELLIEEVKVHFDGLGIPEIAKRTSRSVCSTCGMIKRYLMNKVALERGFDVLATGHNLDDEAASLLGNVLGWRIEYLARQHPLLPSTDGKLVRKVKPLALCSEKETASYAIIRGIDYIVDECPFAEGATSIFYKNLINRLELESPGAKLQFYLGFLKTQPLFRTREPQLRECRICGYPTTLPVCNFCRLKEQLAGRTPPVTHADLGSDAEEP